MPFFQHRPASADDFAAVVDFLPSDQLSHPRAEVLAQWQAWHRQGALTVGIIEAIEGGSPPRIAGVGVTAWISNEAAAHLHRAHEEPCAVQLYRATHNGAHWLLDQQQIAAAHTEHSLNLLILHFWPYPDPTLTEFAAFFMQSVASFRELHDGFGVAHLYQEIMVEHIPIMQAAGMQIARPPNAGTRRVLMSLARDDARANPGSTLSFLFLSPPAKLGLAGAEQNMIALALRQLSDEEIASQLDCSREYIRKLWSRTYDALYANAGLTPDAVSKTQTPGHRREKRRRALEFFRLHPEELRPGVPLR
jgi:hypothetical protein